MYISRDLDATLDATDADDGDDDNMPSDSGSGYGLSSTAEEAPITKRAEGRQLLAGDRDNRVSSF